MKQILAINPGSTSTKIALFEGESPIFEETISHSSEELAKYASIIDQFDFRLELIVRLLQSKGCDLSSLSAVVGRGGLLRPIPSGVYEVTPTMVEDLRSGKYGKHASNLGGLLALEIAKKGAARAFIADPVVVDELEDVARISGHPLFSRVSIFHALNQKAVSRMYARSIGKQYEELNLVVTHLGGGISVGAHRKGLIIDVNNALDGEGAFSPERSGTLPVGQLIDLCFSGRYKYNEIRKMAVGAGGIVGHLGTNDIRKVLADNDPKSKLVLDAMCYNVAKNIGSMAVVLKGEVDAIIITGGIAHSKYVCNYISEMVKSIAPIKIYAGEDEMEALAHNGCLALDAEVEIKVY